MSRRITPHPYHLPRRNRAKPRMDYLPGSITPSPGGLMKKRHLLCDSIRFVRCGGGYRVLRRFRLPGDGQ